MLRWLHKTPKVVFVVLFVEIGCQLHVFHPNHAWNPNQLDTHHSSLGNTNCIHPTSQSFPGGSCSNRRPPILNDGYEPPSTANLLRPPIGTHTYGEVEGGLSDPQAKTSVFSNMWGLGRITPSDIPTNVSYPSDVKEHDLFSLSNVVDRKARGSYVSRSHKVTRVIAPQQREPKRDPVIVHNVRSQ